MKLIKFTALSAGFLALCIALGLLLSGCAALAPGADALIVRTEQLEQTAQASFHLALVIDNEDRGFWRTNAPAFHNWCEWLRVPTKYEARNIFVTTNVTLPRYRVLLLSIDDIKQDYRTSKAYSNSLNSALITLSSVLRQTESWLNIVTNTP